MRTGKMLMLACGILLGSLLSARAETLELLGLSAKIYQSNWEHYPAISSDGKWAAFGHLNQIYVSNLETGTVEQISVSSDGSSANRFCENPVLSADGRFVVFESYATNLVKGDVNGYRDVFLRDRLLGTTEIVNIATDGTQGFLPNLGASPTISGDGRYVAFHTLSPLATKDDNRSLDIYLRDRHAKTTTRITGGIYPALSSDGQFMAFHSRSTLFLRNQQTGKVRIIENFQWDSSRNNPFAYIPSISGDGRYVVYEGWSAPGAPLSTEVFLHDSQTRSTLQITHAFDGSPLSTASGPYNAPLRPKISTDGRFVLFSSSAADLVQGIDGFQLYLYDVVNRSTTRLPIDNLWITTPSFLHLFHIFNISGDGSVIVFQDGIIQHLPNFYPGGTGNFVLRTGVTSGGSTTEGLPEMKINAEPQMLWPPDSKMTDVKLTVAAPGTAAVEIRVVDEYGSFSQTVQGADVTIPLEAWRNANDDDGRTYTITAVAIDASDQTKTATTTVSVPHDQR